ncbi:ABC transporter ATP-binding protein/permease [Gracilibacillus caseinilyticus]|uniref:ABC transporter ATP-binding protein/permease n=1 Tax=Gracilibacillus caseinilyticus TaxID=2932256 RepID=A0ABY4EZ04_9BACI|nr:ABC transporter ATP-binding protein [Gracilibacillus caseinilyticus]UOQ49504.1 ABC transporter ATP-binding protein/permease [Gracilibacillus caseinilyticus]
MKSKSILLYYFRKQKYLVIVYLFLLAMKSLSVISLPLILKFVIDNIIPRKDITYLNYSIIFLIIIMILYALLECLVIYVNNRLIIKTNFSLRKDLINKILNSTSLNLTKKSNGFYVQSIIGDVANCQIIINNVFIKMFVEVITFVVLLIILLNINITLSMVYLAFFPLYFIIYSVSGRVITRISKEFLNNKDMLTKTIYLIHENLEYIKRFKSQSNYVKQYINSSNSLRIWAEKRGLFDGGLKFINSIVQFSLIILLIFFGAKGIINGSMSIGTFVAFYLYSFKFFGPINSILQLLIVYKEKKISMNRLSLIFNLLDEPRGDEPEFKTGNVILNRLSLNLKETKLTEDITFTFSRHKLNFIIGENGLGKSTLIKSFNRIIPVDDGKIFIDDQDVNSISVNRLREKVSINFQQSQFISDSVRDHLDYDIKSESESYNSIMKFLRDYIQLSIGEVSDISKLSGGKRQLVSLYLSLCLKPEVLILDESFSNLDIETSNYIFNSLRKLSSEITIIIITHDLSFILESDNVLDLSKFRIGGMVYGAENNKKFQTY